MTNLEIAHQVKLRPITEVAAAFGLSVDDFERWGTYKGKLTFDGIRRLSAQSENGRLILVTAMTPTLKGEGKTTVTIGLAQGLNWLGRKAISATREPALGPIFGVKGGACGGGYSQVLPMEDINLFFTGDFPAITAAHNLLSAMIDAHLHNGNALRIDASRQLWPRAVDMNDRSLREIVTGLGGHRDGPVRESSFVITPASEIMAILCLSRSIKDLRECVDRLVAAVDVNNKPITARQLGAAGAMTALLKDAVRPNIVQTVEGGLAFVHGGPFGNIAHGCSSIVATECALGASEFMVTEAGFGSDLGAEKFLNIVCPRLGRGPDAIVLVASIRAVQQHGKGALEVGVSNLLHHADHLRKYGPPVVVAINRFDGDTEAEHETLRSICADCGIEAISCDPFGSGGPGCLELAGRAASLAEAPHPFAPLYDAGESILQKLNKIVKDVYGGEGVELEGTSLKDMEWLRKNGYESLPICLAKTQYSLSDDPNRENAPTGFKIHVRSLRLSAGAGFIVATCGDIMLMPGLGKTPAAHRIDVNDNGVISGMF